MAYFIPEFERDYRLKTSSITYNILGSVICSSFRGTIDPLMAFTIAMQIYVKRNNYSDLLDIFSPRAWPRKMCCRLFLYAVVYGNLSLLLNSFKENPTAVVNRNIYFSPLSKRHYCMPRTISLGRTFIN